ncbi:hypothetical protein [Oryzifoliimicrobium ureilyticus]|uniref:hypothetical protein n=1 Tax=Oryzifoliimicrobium ureilyticus TaxID=3113724 RepID=UPI0030764837
MIRFFTKANTAVVLVATALTALSAPAFAQVDVYVDRDRPPPPRYYRADPPPYGWDRPRRGCNPAMAEDIARDFGFRRARVVDVTPRRVVVEGWTRRGPGEISFANRPGCPVLRR